MDEKINIIPKVTENLEFQLSQSPGIGRSQLARISNTGDVAIAPTAGAFASVQNQVFSHLGYKPYTTLYFDDGEKFLEALSPHKRYALITDTHIEKLYGKALCKKIQDIGCQVEIFSFNAGEEQKTRATKERIEDGMLEKNFGRDSCVIALGGGVTTDIAGFIAATYCRGIPYFSIPTSLMGMVDAAVGGKTGINTQHGKNLIGAFHPPEHISINLEFLNTLPEKEWRNGFAEMIKYGLIISTELFDLMEKDIRSDIKKGIWLSLQAKKEVIEKDFNDATGLRNILNFGHTFGHALENLLEYKIGHGEAVAIGLLFESYLSYKLGYLRESDLMRIHELLKKYQYCLTIPKSISFDSLLRSMCIDKKALKNTPRFVILEKIGTTASFNEKYCTEVPIEYIEEAYGLVSN